ncbi:Ppx/GppA phosphatase family protein [Mucilaginibacter aquatilis]|nr:exopolyphosphatase [Mucilaginibacter aquatilis]
MGFVHLSRMLPFTNNVPVLKNYKNRVAVMDLGTNTFHLTIAEPDESFFKVIHHEHLGVKLGKGGINEGTIQPEAFERGLDALKNFKLLIDRHEAKAVKAIATSAMRSASNGEKFMSEVYEATGIQIETITGDREATYIYEGVKASGCLTDADSLIIDIGGGSVEFIICNSKRIHYKRSFEVGAARLMALFHHSDPISNTEISKLTDYLDEKLNPLYEAASGYQINDIVGSSGAFETFAELIEHNKNHEFDISDHLTYRFTDGELNQVLNEIIDSTHNERKFNKGIATVRVDMIVVAALLTRHLLHKLNVKNVVMTAYSLKEGVLACLLNEENV